MAARFSREELVALTAPTFTIGQEEWPTGYLLRVAGGMFEDGAQKLIETDLRHGKQAVAKIRELVEEFWRPYVTLDGWEIEVGRVEQPGHALPKSWPQAEMWLMAPPSEFDGPREKMDHALVWVEAL